MQVVLLHNQRCYKNIHLNANLFTYKHKNNFPIFLLFEGIFSKLSCMFSIKHSIERFTVDKNIICSCFHISHASFPLQLTFKPNFVADVRIRHVKKDCKYFENGYIRCKPRHYRRHKFGIFSKYKEDRFPSYISRKTGENCYSNKREEFSLNNLKFHYFTTYSSNSMGKVSS